MRAIALLLVLGPLACGEPAHPQPDGAFDRGAASGAIGAVDARPCAALPGPSGQGHVKMTFAPDGSLTAVTLDRGAFGGTPRGDCVIEKYRVVHVPPFKGAPISVGKTFTLE